MIEHPIYAKAARGEYLEPKDLATLIRDALKRAFPTTKFTVRSSRGGGSSVDIGWMDGPTTKAVDRIANGFKTKGFDGMIDLEHRNSLWLYPDGSAHVAHDEGTTGSMGCHSEIIESPKSGDAVLVESVASCYVFTHRDLTPRAYHRAIAEYRAQNWVGAEEVDWSRIEVATSDYDGSGHLKNCPCVQIGNDWLEYHIHRLACSYDLTEPDAAPAHQPVLCW